MGEVLEFLIDGTSGLAPGGVDGKALLAGVCSKGQVGKAYLLGKRSNIAEMLGTGPLAEAVQDMLISAGQEPVVLAVPVQGSGGSIGVVEMLETMPEDAPVLSVTGTARAAVRLLVEINRDGALNQGTCRLSLDNGQSFAASRTLPVDGVLELPDLGISLRFAEGEYLSGWRYSCRLTAPHASIVDVMAALESPLALYDVEYVHIVGASDAVDWAAVSSRADELWRLHRPTYFKMETRLPDVDEDLNDFCAWLLAERKKFTGRFVQVCCQFGEILSPSGQSAIRNWAGLQAGRVSSLPVQRATGRVKDGPISQGRLPEGWMGVQAVLEEAGYLTAKKYAGLAGAYWGDSRTMAEDSSDYRYEEVLRVVFKAVRTMRIAALKSLYDEVGDPRMPSSASGIGYLKAQLENALDSMTKAIPRELAAYVIDIPPGQDIINNGVAVESTLIGLPIIRKITLFASYVYSGSSFDPRLN